MSRDREVRIPVAGGGELSARLRLPTSAVRPPCVVLAHGLGLPRGAGLPDLAAAYADRGLATLRFDYRHTGASPGEPRQLLDPDRQLDDLRAAVAWTRAQREFAGVAVWGYSVGGGHALRLAAEDSGLAAAVARCPASDPARTLLGFGAARLIALGGAGGRDAIGGRLGRPPRTVPIADVHHRAAPFRGAHDSAGYLSLIPAGTAFENSFAPRVALKAPLPRPIRGAHRIRCPLLVIVGERDRITPPGPSLRLAGRAPRGRAERYDADHFEVFTGPLSDEVRSAEIAFLAAHLL